MTLTPKDRELARNFAGQLETAHGIKRPGLAKVSGKHLSDAANETGDFARIEAEANADARAIVRGKAPT